MVSQINNLEDLDNFRSAPDLDKEQTCSFLKEIDCKISSSDWITLGIMAPSDETAKESLNFLLKRYSHIKLNNFNHLVASGEVFLKANQKTGNVFIRSENGLGQGILLTCQYEDQITGSNTFGPFPLDFFSYL